MVPGVATAKNAEPCNFNAVLCWNIGQTLFAAVNGNVKSFMFFFFPAGGK